MSGYKKRTREIVMASTLASMRTGGLGVKMREISIASETEREDRQPYIADRGWEENGMRARWDE